MGDQNDVGTVIDDEKNEEVLLVNTIQLRGVT